MQVVVLEGSRDAAAANRSAASRIRSHPVLDQRGLRVVQPSGVGVRQGSRRLDERPTQATTSSGASGKVGTAGGEHGVRVVGEHALHAAVPLHHRHPVGHGRHLLVVPHGQAEVGGRQPPAVEVDGEGRGDGIRDEPLDDLDQPRLEGLGRCVLLDPDATGIGLDAGDDRPEPHPLAHDRGGGPHPDRLEGRDEPRLEVRQPLRAPPEGRQVSARARRPATHSTASA